MYYILLFTKENIKNIKPQLLIEDFSIFIFEINDMKPMNITIKDNIIHDNSNAPNAPYPCFVHVILV